MKFYYVLCIIATLLAFVPRHIIIAYFAYCIVSSIAVGPRHLYSVLYDDPSSAKPANHTITRLPPAATSSGVQKIYTQHASFAAGGSGMGLIMGCWYSLVEYLGPCVSKKAAVWSFICHGFADIIQPRGPMLCSFFVFGFSGRTARKYWRILSDSVQTRRYFLVRLHPSIHWWFDAYLDWTGRV